VAIVVALAPPLVLVALEASPDVPAPPAPPAPTVEAAVLDEVVVPLPMVVELAPAELLAEVELLALLVLPALAPPALDVLEAFAELLPSPDLSSEPQAQVTAEARKIQVVRDMLCVYRSCRATTSARVRALSHDWSVIVSFGCPCISFFASSPCRQLPANVRGRLG
jgi:hypothetical protein